MSSSLSSVLLFDTSIYIPYLRSEAYGELLDRAARWATILRKMGVAARIQATRQEDYPR